MLYSLRLSVFLVSLSVFVWPLTAFAQGAFSGGNWVKLATDTKTDKQTGDALRIDYFAKKSSVKVIGDNQYQLELLSNLTPAFSGDKSWLMKLDLNCDNLYSRTVAMSGYSEPFARGKKNFGGSDAASKWQAPDRGDKGWMAMVNKLCGPK